MGSAVIKERDEDDPIEEEIEGYTGNQSPAVQSSSQKEGTTTTQDSTSEAASRNKKELMLKEERIEFTESLKRREGILKDAMGVDHSGSNTQTFGRQSRTGEASQDPATLPGEETEEELVREGADSYYPKNLIDPSLAAEQKKRLLYDKSLKAYYDPETGQYFEMKPRMMAKESLGRL